MRISNSKFGIFNISCLFLVAALLLAVISHRGMIGEGSEWYLKILETHAPFKAFGFYRYISYVLQAPAVLLLLIQPYFQGININRIAIYLLDVCYILHPLVSLYYVKKLLLSKGRSDLFIFPILSFLGGSLVALTFSVGLALPALSVFWPLFFLILLRNKNSNIENFFVSALFLGLVFSYEPAILFFLLFIVISVFELFWKKNSARVFYSAVILASFLCIVFLANALLTTIPAKSSAVFLDALFNQLDAVRVFVFSSAILIFAYICNSWLENRGKNYVITIIATVFLALCFWFILVLSRTDYFHSVGYFVSPYVGNDARSTAVPWAFGLACIVTFLKFSGVSWLWKSEAAQKKTFIMLGFVIFLVSLADIKMTYHWNRGLENLRNFVHENSGCRNLDQSTYDTLFSASNITPYALHATAILVQVLENYEPVKLLVFTKAKLLDKVSERNACHYFKDNVFTNNQDRILFIKGTYLNYSPVVFESVVPTN